MVERGRKIHEEKKNEGRLEGERGRELSLVLAPPPPVLPSVSPVFPAALYY